MTYWIRVNGSPSVLGPFSLKELAADARNGKIPQDSEYLEATGQSLGALKRAVDWRPIKELRLPTSSPSGIDQPEAAAEALDFPALRMIAGIFKVMAVVTLVLGITCLVIALTVNNSALVIAAIVWTLLVPLCIWATAEVVLVFLQIERNTRPVTLAAVRGTVAGVTKVNNTAAGGG